jgi:hypothetical protein
MSVISENLQMERAGIAINLYLEALSPLIYISLLEYASRKVLGMAFMHLQVLIMLTN